MSDILKKILATKVREIAENRVATPEAVLREQIALGSGPRDFLGAIRAKHANKQAAVIAEIKRASPSAGTFRAEGAEFAPAFFAKSYEQHGAACLSVLTDRDYFQGSVADLMAAKAACKLPILRKDFIIDAYQILEARAMGADAILLIAGAVPLLELQNLERVALDLGMSVLVESHNAAELQQALTLQTPLIGINNRDLTRFVTNIQTTFELQSAIPADRILVTESGIVSREIVMKMHENSVNTFLVGGAFMQAPDPGKALADMFY
jgi:indole-3-glycerol phosphate synthase